MRHARVNGFDDVDLSDLLQLRELELERSYQIDNLVVGGMVTDAQTSLGTWAARAA